MKRLLVASLITLSAFGQLYWPDRRPIAALFISGATQTAENPRRYQVQSGTPDFLGAGFATAKAGLLSYVSAKLDYADSLAARPQAIVVWDLEGEEFQPIFTYVGSPNLLSAVSPEMDLMADDIFALIRNRGYVPGLTLRPHEILHGTGRPTNLCRVQGGNDGQVYIDTSASWPNRGYRCGPATVTFNGTNTIQASGAFAVGYQNGSSVQFYTTGTLPSGLSPWTEYYLCSWDNGAQTLQVSTQSNCSSSIGPLSGGSGTHTMMSWRGPVNLPVQELPADQAEAYSNLKAKALYAYRRWGVRVFYVDSTYACGNTACQSGNVVLTDASVWTQLQADFPDCLFMPENSAGGPYTGKHLSFNNAQYKRDPSTAATYPDYFVVPQLQGTTPGYAEWRSEILLEIAAGVPYMPNINASSAVNTSYSADASDPSLGSVVTLTDTNTGGTRTYTGNPRGAYTYPLKMRVAFKANSSFDGTETTYCEKRDTAKCWAAGVQQGSAALNLSGMTHRRIEYRDFHGRLVSAGSAEGL